MNYLLTFDVISREMLHLVSGHYGEIAQQSGTISGQPEQIEAVIYPDEKDLRRSVDEFSERLLAYPAKELAALLDSKGPVCLFQLPLPRTSLYAARHTYHGMVMRTTVDWMLGTDQKAIRFDIGFVKDGNPELRANAT